MKRKNTTRNALFTSIISLLMCVSMLVGTTFAWFTDSVVSGTNVIAAGNLDVELEYAKVVDGQITDWNTVQGADKVFDPNALWEPGRVEVVYLKVSNLGTLNLKYQLGVNVASEIPGTNVKDESFLLSDSLVFKAIEMPDALTTYSDREAVQLAAGTEKGLKDYNGITTALEPNGTDYVALIVYMPTTVGNEANYKTGTNRPEINLGVNLFATQVEAESDSFGSDYDKNAWVDGFDVHSAQDLQAALNNGETAIDLMADIETDEPIMIPEGATVTLNLSGKSLGGNIEIPAGAKLTVGNGTVANTDSGVSGIQNNGGELVLDNVTVESARHGVRVEDGNVTINSGEFIVAPTSSMTVHALNVSDGATVTINGGTFVGPKGTIADSGSAVCVQAGSTVIINGGNFSGGKNSTLTTKEGATLTVKGGTFDQDPSAYVATGYKSVEVNGVYYVVAEDITLAYDAASLVAAMQNGGNISVLNNIDLSETTVILPAGKSAALDLNGNTISGTFENVSNANKTLIDVKGNLTVNGAGTITMKTTGINMGWNAMGCTICVNGGDLTVNDATIKNEGGTDMAFALDTNPWNPADNAVLDVVLNNAVIESTQYRGIRVRDNGPYTVKLVANESTIDEIWYQEYNPDYGTQVEIYLTNTTADVSRVNKGTLVIDGAAMVKDVDALAEALANGGDVIYTGSELVVNEALTVNGSLTISNATIDADAAGEIVVDGGTLTLGKGAVLSVEGEMPTAGVIRVIDDSEIILDGAEITGCDNKGTGVLINVAAGAKMTIEDGTVISDNVVAGSGNTPNALIKVCGELVMNGGEIVNNKFAHKALISIEGGKFVMNGGEIANNTFTGTGVTSVFYFFTGTAKFEMNDGTIADNNLGTNSSSAVFNTSTVNAADVLVVTGGTVKADKFAYVRGFDSLSIASTANVSGSVYAFWDGITKDVSEITE